MTELYFELQAYEAKSKGHFKRAYRFYRNMLRLGLGLGLIRHDRWLF